MTVVARAMSNPGSNDDTSQRRGLEKAAAMFGLSTFVTSHDLTLAIMSVHRFHKDWRMDLVDSSLRVFIESRKCVRRREEV